MSPIPLGPQPGGVERGPPKMFTPQAESLAYPNMTPTHLEVPWGTGPNEVCDVYVNPHTGTNRSVVFWLHGGAGVVGDLRQPSKGGNGLGSALLHYIFTHELPVTFDFVSVGHEKWDWRAPTPVTHIPQYVPTLNPTLFPENVNRLSALWPWVSASAVMYGWSDENWHLGGVSHGGVLAMLARFTNGAPVKSLVIESPISDYRDPSIYWPVGEGMAGTPDQAAWEAVLDSEKDAMSALLQLTLNPAPVFIGNALVGTHVPPYGSGEGGNVHDSAQAVALADELTALSIPHTLKLYSRLALDTPKYGVAIAQTAYVHMVASQ